MSTTNELRQTIADFFGVPESQVGPPFSMRSRSESIARAALDAAIRHRVGRVSRMVYSAKTYGEIEAELFPSEMNATSGSMDDASKPRPDSPPAAAMPVAGGVSCGIDMESVENLPAVDDYWEAPFYRTHFAPAEIAYCLRQETPTIHFAARWCVKEALKKCTPSFLTEEMSRIELVVGESGAPYLLHHFNGVPQRLPHAVSVSHTTDAAVASVVKVDVPAVTLPTPNSATPATLATAPTPPKQSIDRVLLASLSVSLGAFLLAAIALFRSM